MSKARNNAELLRKLPRQDSAGGPGLLGYSGAFEYALGSTGGHFRGTVSPTDYPWLADPTGATEVVGPGTGILACLAFAKANNYQVEFKQGEYKCPSPWLIDWSYADIVFQGKVHLIYTGAATSYFIAIDGGDVGFLWRVRFGAGNKPLITATGCQSAVWVRSMHHGHVEFACDAAVTQVMLANHSVCSRYSVTASWNEKVWSTRPVHGLVLDERLKPDTTSEGAGFAACIMDNCIIEGTSGDGVVNHFAQDVIWIGGTSEGNGGKGYTEDSNSAANTLIGFDCESNTGLDFELGGHRTIVLNGVGSSPDTGVKMTGQCNALVGGRYSKIEVTGVGNILENLDYLDAHSHGGLIDTGVRTVKRNVRVATTHSGILLPDTARYSRAKVIGGMLVTSITRALEAVVTFGVVSGMEYNDSITFSGVVGMTEVNGQTYQLEPTSDSSNSYYLMSGGAYVDSTAFGAFVSGTATHVAFSGTWVTFGAGFRDPYYSRNPDNRVYLGGSIKSGTTGTTAFTLPAGNRPAATVVFTTANFNVPNTTFVSITSGGVVTVVNSTNTNHISLDGISFMAEL